MTLKQIHTREQLLCAIQDIIAVNVDEDGFGIYEAAVEICDLIADLPNLCFHSKNE